jgi:(p)ppGpp synthase/HD superfamily hydrolase
MKNNRNTLDIAATVAFIAEAHRGQKYGSMPYFFHPVEVAEMAEHIATEEAPLGWRDDRTVENVKLVALLHDVIEDTDYTAQDLRTRYSDTVVDAVVLLSHDTALEYLDNIQRIIDSGNKLAMMVKLADNRVNRRGDKSSFRPEKAARLNARYDASIALLTPLVCQ